MDILNRIYKALNFKRYTSDYRDLHQEKSIHTIITHKSNIWFDDINSNPSVMVSSGTAKEFSKFPLTPSNITSLSESVFYLQSGSSFNAGTSSYDDSFSQTEFIPNVFGSLYKANLFDNQNRRIFENDPIDWYWDYKTGVLTVGYPESSSANILRSFDIELPYKITTYQFTGRYLSDINITSGSSPGSSTSQSILFEQKGLSVITSGSDQIAFTQSISNANIISGSITNVFLNGVLLELGYSNGVYFSGSNGFKLNNNVEYGDYLYWNGTTTEFELQNDNIQIQYLVN